MSEFFTDLFVFTPGSPMSGLKVGLLVGLILFLFLIMFLTPMIRRKTQNKALKKVLGQSRVGMTTFALTLLFFLLMRLEQVYFLSMRLWIYLTILLLGVWFAWKLTAYWKIQRRIDRAEMRRQNTTS